MTQIRVGVQLHPQHTTWASFADAVRRAEDLGCDTIWNWDHFFRSMATRRAPISRVGRC